MRDCTQPKEEAGPNKDGSMTTTTLLPWRRVLLKKLTVSLLVKKFPAFSWNPKVHFVFARACHLSLS
jgi:hypothetical protein